MKSSHQSVADFNATNFNKRHIFVTSQYTQAPSIEKVNFPRTYSIKCEDQIFDAEKNVMRVIRVVPGEISIFKDEQRPDGPGEVRKVTSIMFTNGEKVVEQRETQLLKFLQMCNMNGSNKNRDKRSKIHFYEVDVKAGLDDQKKKDKTSIDALNWCYDATPADILTFGRVLGYDTVSLGVDDIRMLLTQNAKQNPEKFMGAVSNPATKRKHYIMDAVEKGVLEVNSFNNSIQWKNGGVIYVSPNGVNPIDALVDITFASDDGEKIFNLIKTRLVASNMNFVAPEEAKIGKLAESAFQVDGEKAIRENNATPEAISESEEYVAMLFEKNVLKRKNTAIVWGMDDKKFVGKNVNFAKHILLFPDIKKELDALLEERLKG